MTLKFLVEEFPKIRLGAECLEDKNAHPYNSLLGGIQPTLQRIEQHQNHEFVPFITIDDKRSKASIALQGFPKEHNYLGSPAYGFLAAWQI